MLKSILNNYFKETMQYKLYIIINKKLKQNFDSYLYKKKIFKSKNYLRTRCIIIIFYCNYQLLIWGKIMDPTVDVQGTMEQK
jgi:hypothetical protein